MQRPTPTSGAPTSRRGSTESTFSPEGSPVLPFHKPANEKELPTTATCGPKCIEQFSKSARAGSWQKMFSALLIGMEGWFSNRCTLTWKLRDTPYKRSYFQLAASTHRTNGTEHGLLPTVTTTNSAQGFHSKNGAGQPLLPMAALLQTPTRTAIENRRLAALLKRKEMRNESGRETIPPGNLAEQIYSVMNGGTLTDMSAILPEPGPDRGLLPTPNCMDMKFGQKVTGKTKIRKTGTTFSSGLRDLAHSGLLPTPAAFDQKTCRQQVTGKTITRQTGETFTAGLRMLAPNGLLPTPTARCHNAGAEGWDIASFGVESSGGSFCWEGFPTVPPPVLRGDDGFSEILHGISFPHWRRESIKAYGNAIVPQLAYRIFRVIDYMSNGR